jgi:hypothetical protein
MMITVLLSSETSTLTPATRRNSQKTAFFTTKGKLCKIMRAEKGRAKRIAYKDKDEKQSKGGIV